jgi:hypothetical protein
VDPNSKYYLRTLGHLTTSTLSFVSGLDVDLWRDFCEVRLVPVRRYVEPNLRTYKVSDNLSRDQKNGRPGIQLWLRQLIVD